MDFRQAIIIIVSCFITTHVNAYDFYEAYSRALSHDAKYQQQIYINKAQQQLIPQARALLLPNVNLTADSRWQAQRLKQGEQRSNVSDNELQSNSDSTLEITPLTLEGTPVDIQDDYRTYNAQINLTQTLFNLSLWTNLKQAQSQAAESNLQLDDRRQDLSLEVTDAYFDYLRATESAYVLEKELQAIKEHQWLTEERQKNDLGTQVDVYESTSRYELAYVNYIDFINNQMAARYLLTRLTGKALIEAKGLEDKNNLKLITPNNINEWIDSAKRQAYSVQLAQQQVKTAELEIKKQRAAHYPTLQLRAQSSFEDNELSDFRAETQTYRDEILLELNVPIFSGFSVRSKVKEAAYRLVAATEGLRGEIEKNEQQIRTNYTTAVNNFKRLNRFRRAFDDSLSALNLRKEGFLQGLSSNLDLLDAYRETYKAERDWRQARYDYLFSILRLKRVSHNITENDIASINTLLTKIVKE